MPTRQTENRRNNLRGTVAGGAPKAQSRQKASAHSSPGRKSKSVKNGNDRAPAKETEVATLRARVTYLETENGKLIAEKEAMARRVEEVKRSIEQKLREIQEGISHRLDRGESKSSIMEYVKAGFGTMLGALAALLVVNLAIDAFDALASPDEDPSASANNSAAQENASSTAAEYGNVGDAAGSNDLFSLFGGGSKKTSGKKTASSSRRKS